MPTLQLSDVYLCPSTYAETAATQKKAPAYADYQNLGCPLVRAGGLRFYSPRIPF